MMISTVTSIIATMALAQTGFSVVLELPIMFYNTYVRKQGLLCDHDRAYLTLGCLPVGCGQYVRGHTTSSTPALVRHGQRNIMDGRQEMH